MDDEIPRLRRPEDMPPVLSQADLHRHWRALVNPLGFHHSRLYLRFVPPDGRVDGFVLEIEDLPELPVPAAATALFRMCRMVIEADYPEGTRVAVLYARPGRRGTSAVDRAWGRAVIEAAVRAGVDLWQVHLANDEELHVLAPDDLVEPA